MNKNLTCILKSFSKNEWNEFGDFISSPYFTKSRDYGQLFKFLKKYLTSEINKAELSIEDIQISLRPLLSDRTINNRLSELSKLAERFLRIKNVEKNPIKNYSCLYEELISRNLYCNFYKSFKTKKNKFSPVDVNDFIPYCGIIQAEGFYHRSMQNFPETINQFSKQAEYVSAFSLDRLLYYYTEYFLFDKWKIKYSAVNFKTFFESVDFDKIAEEYKNNGNKIYAPFLLRYYMLKALQNTDDRNLAAGARIFFENNKSLFSINVKIDYFQKMQAYYNSLINKGDEDAIKEAHQLHKERIEDSETIDFSIMQYPVTEFRDFVIVGLNAGDFKWVEDFIDKYSSKLHPSIRNEEITSAKVRMYIKKKDLLTAIHLLQKQKTSKNHVHNMDSYMYKIKLYFELEMEDKMELEIDNLRHYINKNELLELQIKNAKEFIAKLQRLNKILNNCSKETLTEFTEDIKNNTYSVENRRWFLKILDGIEKKAC